MVMSTRWMLVGSLTPFLFSSQIVKVSNIRAFSTQRLPTCTRVDAKLSKDWLAVTQHRISSRIMKTGRSSSKA